MPFNVVDWMRAIIAWIGRDALLPFVSVFYCARFFFLNKWMFVRQAMPANGAAMVHRQWVDDRGNPSSCSVVLWVGQPLGPGGRDQA
jgi:hypothetical protein